MSRMIIVLLFAVQVAFSQQWTIVYLKDKANNGYLISEPLNFLSEKAIQRRTKQGILVKPRDLPLSQIYLDSLNKLGFKVIGKSKWLNAVLIEGIVSDVNKLSLGFIAKTAALSRAESRTQRKLISEESTSPTLQSEIHTLSNYGQASTQVSMLGVDLMHTAGFKGEGMLIAVFDEGFYNVDKLAAFDSLNLQNRILATYNFQERSVNVFEKGTHGTNVLSCLAANTPNVLVGTAPNSKYVLLKTEVSEYEYPIEEFFWAEAAEYSDSIGVDLINSSLGYTDFDNSSLDHSYSDLDGKTTISSRAATIASEVGMVVCNSAGNEGARSWKYIKAPADAHSILAIGSVTTTGSKSSFSSIGPSADGRIKPDLSALGSSVSVIDAFSGAVVLRNGTSFASPLVCGLAAGMWQSNPELTNLELMELLKSTASQSNSPDNLVGYGIPRFQSPEGLSEKFITNLYVVNPIVNQTLELNLKYNLTQAQLADILLFDAYGKLVVSIKNASFFEHNRYQLPTSLSKGLYLLRLQNGSSNKEYKLVVQ